ncbi:hypothetical protein HDU82_004110, partial [Entophlyctis luteolus]
GVAYLLEVLSPARDVSESLSLPIPEYTAGPLPLAELLNDQASSEALKLILNSVAQVAETQPLPPAQNQQQQHPVQHQQPQAHHQQQEQRPRGAARNLLANLVNGIGAAFDFDEDNEQDIVAAIAANNNANNNNNNAAALLNRRVEHPGSVVLKLQQQNVAVAANAARIDADRPVENNVPRVAGGGDEAQIEAVGNQQRPLPNAPPAAHLQQLDYRGHVASVYREVFYFVHDLFASLVPGADEYLYNQEADAGVRGGDAGGVAAGVADRIGAMGLGM